MTMMVLILAHVPDSLRGELSRWLLEPKANVFVGNATATVRRQLWQKTRKALRADSGALLLWHSNTEQGFAMESHGTLTREVIDHEGILLVRRDHPNPEKTRRKLNASIPDGVPRLPFDHDEMFHDLGWRPPPRNG